MRSGSPRRRKGPRRLGWPSRSDRSRGTGSNHFQVDERFVSEDYAVRKGRMVQAPPERPSRAYPIGYFDFGAGAAKVPYHHANVDCDEVLFYAAGDFMSRAGSGIGVGSISFHPAGFVHGPQPGSVEASIGSPGTDEWAVMIDTFRPLQLGAAAMAVEDTGYRWTWAGGRKD